MWLQVTRADGSTEVLRAKNILIATGGYATKVRTVLHKGLKDTRTAKTMQHNAAFMSLRSERFNVSGSHTARIEVQHCQLQLAPVRASWLCVRCV
jgi:pyruvate/2-oxoglutarate dehydrogenase complex dihydrolipoamide dehydrogenase (E3) component